MRAFADYLQQCNMATEHISGLNILNDCHENRKINEVTKVAHTEVKKDIQ